MQRSYYEYAPLLSHIQLKLNSNSNAHNMNKKIDVVNFNYIFSFFFHILFRFVLFYTIVCCIFMICFVAAQQKDYSLTHWLTVFMLIFSYKIKSNLHLYDFLFSSKFNFSWIVFFSSTSNRIMTSKI